MFRPVLLLTLAAVSLAAGTAVADVYKYKDAKGNIQYTDKPPSLPAERLNVQSQRTDVVAAQERSQAAVARQAGNAADPAANKPASPPPAPEPTGDQKADACAKAKHRYDSYMTSQRMYQQGQVGERRYLSDAELDAARASAKASMDVLCQ
jgi:hypothetical protein